MLGMNGLHFFVLAALVQKNHVFQSEWLLGLAMLSRVLLGVLLDQFLSCNLQLLWTALSLHGKPECVESGCGVSAVKGGSSTT